VFLDELHLVAVPVGHAGLVALDVDGVVEVGGEEPHHAGDLLLSIAIELLAHLGLVHLGAPLVRYEAKEDVVAPELDGADEGPERVGGGVLRVELERVGGDPPATILEDQGQLVAEVVVDELGGDLDLPSVGGEPLRGLLHLLRAVLHHLHEVVAAVAAPVARGHVVVGVAVVAGPEGGDVRIHRREGSFGRRRGAGPDPEETQEDEAQEDDAAHGQILAGWRAARAAMSARTWRAATIEQAAAPASAIAGRTKAYFSV